MQCIALHSFVLLCLVSNVMKCNVVDVVRVGAGGALFWRPCCLLGARGLLVCCGTPCVPCVCRCWVLPVLAASAWLRCCVMCVCCSSLRPALSSFSDRFLFLKFVFREVKSSGAVCVEDSEALLSLGWMVFRKLFETRIFGSSQDLISCLTVQLVSWPVSTRNATLQEKFAATSKP